MKYAYPKISNTLTYYRNGDGSVDVTEFLTENCYTFDPAAAAYMTKLDGHTHPYQIPSPLSSGERDELIRFLDGYEFIRWNNIHSICPGTRMRTLFIPKDSSLLWLFAYLSNALLLIAWLPTLILGIFLFSRRLGGMDFDWGLLGYVAGLLIGITAHEFGHAFAGIAYGAKIYEMGTMIMHFALPGAYVLMDCEPVRRKLRRVQINAAGVETNFLLCGLFLILGAAFPKLGGIFLDAALCNVFLGALNLSLLRGVDGQQILLELLGLEENLLDRTFHLLLRKETRGQVLRPGSGGIALIAVCVILGVLQLVWPVLLISNILEVIACFV